MSNPTLLEAAKAVVQRYDNEDGALFEESPNDNEVIDRLRRAVAREEAKPAAVDERPLLRELQKWLTLEIAALNARRDSDRGRWVGYRATRDKIVELLARPAPASARAELSADAQNAIENLSNRYQGDDDVETLCRVVDEISRRLASLPADAAPEPLPQHLGLEWIKAPKDASCLDHGAPLVRVWKHRATFECGCEHWFGTPADAAPEPKPDEKSPQGVTPAGSGHSTVAESHSLHGESIPSTAEPKPDAADDEIEDWRERAVRAMKDSKGAQAIVIDDAVAIMRRLRDRAEKAERAREDSTETAERIVDEFRRERDEARAELEALRAERDAALDRAERYMATAEELVTRLEGRHKRDGGDDE